MDERIPVDHHAGIAQCQAVADMSDVPTGLTKVSRRRFLRNSALGAAAFALAGCAESWPQPSPKAREKAQLVYQDWRTDWFPPMARTQLEAFQAAHPNIRVYYTPDPENLESKMLTDMQEGRAADVFQGCCAHFPVWAQKGYCLDLRPYVESDLDHETVDEWDRAQYESFFLPDGRQYGLPKYHGALAVYYNKRLFDDQKVGYPSRDWTSGDYLSAMKQLTFDQDGDGRTDVWGSTLDISWDRIQMYVNGWGGHFVDPTNPTRSQMGDPTAVAALRWLRDRMWQDRVMATLTDIRKVSLAQAFVSGHVAMIEDGSWALKTILSGAKFPLGVATYPAGPVRRVTLATTDGFGIYAGTKYPDAAWELMKFLISADYGRAMARANFLQPARRSLVDEWVGIIREDYPEQTRDVDIAAFADGHMKGYCVTAEIFTNQAAATELAYEAWDRILTLGQDPAESIIPVSKQIEAAQHGVSKVAGKCC